MAKKDNRPVVTLECTVCNSRNYTTAKSRRNDPGRIELMKYCAVERKHTLHRESK